jgi:hypothetical protein
LSLYGSAGRGAEALPQRRRPIVDDSIVKHRIALAGSDATWRDLVSALCEIEEFRLAEIAQRYAVPVLEDLIAASRSEQVQDMFAQLRVARVEKDRRESLIVEQQKAAQKPPFSMRAGANLRCSPRLEQGQEGP